MGSSFIYGKGGGGKQTASPTVTITNVGPGSVAFTVKNNDDSLALLAFELTDGTPDEFTLELASGATSSEYTVNNLSVLTSYSIFAYATTAGKKQSETTEEVFTTTTPENFLYVFEGAWTYGGAMIIDSDGNYVMTARGGGGDSYILKVDTTGSLLAYIELHGGTSTFELNDIIQVSNGDYVVHGRNYGAFSGTSYTHYIAKINNALTAIVEEASNDTTEGNEYSYGIASNSDDTYMAIVGDWGSVDGKGAQMMLLNGSTLAQVQSYGFYYSSYSTYAGDWKDIFLDPRDNRYISTGYIYRASSTIAWTLGDHTQNSISSENSVQMVFSEGSGLGERTIIDSAGDYISVGTVGNHPAIIRLNSSLQYQSGVIFNGFSTSVRGLVEDNDGNFIIALNSSNLIKVDSSFNFIDGIDISPANYLSFTTDMDMRYDSTNDWFVMSVSSNITGNYEASLFIIKGDFSINGEGSGYGITVAHETYAATALSTPTSYANGLTTDSFTITQNLTPGATIVTTGLYTDTHEVLW